MEESSGDKYKIKISLLCDSKVFVAIAILLIFFLSYAFITTGFSVPYTKRFFRAGFITSIVTRLRMKFSLIHPHSAQR